MQDLRNILSGFGNPENSGPDPSNMSMGAPAGALRGFKPFGHTRAKSFQSGLSMVRTNLYKSSALNSDDGSFGVTETIPGGALLMTTGATAHMGRSIQESYDGGTTAIKRVIIPDTDDDITQVFGAYVRLSEVSTVALMLGVGTVSTDPLSAASAINIADYVGWFKTSGAATALGRVRTASTSTDTAALGTFVVDTYHLLEVRILPKRTGIEFWFDGIMQANQTTLTNLPAADTALALTIAFTTTSANSRTARIIPFLGGEVRE